MRLTILGAGTSLPVAQHSAAGYLVRVGELASPGRPSNGVRRAARGGEIPLLLDAGPGTLARLAAAGVSYRDLQYVFITHLHSDHTLDLVTLLQSLVATPGWKREQPLFITGCVGLDTFLQQLVQVYNGVAPRGYELIVSEMREERREFPAWTIETALTGHTENSIGFRIEAEGRVLVYSGDAVESDKLVELARDADVFVCECALPSGSPPTNHLRADQVGRIAQKANVKRLMLTHLYPPALESDVVAQARAEFRGTVIQAVDGMELRV